MNGGFSQQLTSDIIVDTLSTKLNRKQTDAKSGAGGDAKRLGSHTYLIRGKHGKAGGRGPDDTSCHVGPHISEGP